MYTVTNNNNRQIQIKQSQLTYSWKLKKIHTSEIILNKYDTRIHKYLYYTDRRTIFYIYVKFQ